MPTISMFYGILIKMNYKEHNPPHFHAQYQDYEATFNFDGTLRDGEMPIKQRKMIEVWSMLHIDELNGNWQLAKEREALYKIDPLK